MPKLMVCDAVEFAGTDHELTYPDARNAEYAPVSVPDELRKVNPVDARSISLFPDAFLKLMPDVDSHIRTFSELSRKLIAEVVSPISCLFDAFLYESPEVDNVIKL